VLNASNVQVASGTGSSFSWTPTAVGNFTVKFTVTDGGVPALSGTSSLAVSITSTKLVGGLLTVLGNGSANTINVTKVSGNLQVNVDGQAAQLFSSTAVTGIFIDAGAGNDVVTLGSSVLQGAEVHGGDGADIITAGGGDDMLFGENGPDLIQGVGGNDVFVGGDDTDILLGGDGRDVLIGGLGSDYVGGDNGDDILIAGTTDWDANVSQLAAIRSVWVSTASYSSRVSTLQGNLLSSSRVHDDGSVDILSGNNGRDWFVENTNAPVTDIVLDRAGNETVTDVV
jgi:hypothetical protein